jgi:hypothetical protein
MDDIDASDDYDVKNPKAIPDELYDYFTVGRSYERVDKWMRSDVYLGGDAFQSVWTKEEIEKNLALIENRTLHGTYGVGSTNMVRDALLDSTAIDLRNKTILVIGSERPWLESICLYGGARHVTTLEYGKIVSEHPQISTMTPDEFREKYTKLLREGPPGTARSAEEDDMFFDGVVSHSSLEHSGLGRYGDALNPWGDLLAVARAWCVTKHDQASFMFMGVPTGNDMILSNWHRVYGKVRWPLLAANWRHVEHADENHLVRVGSSTSQGGGHPYIFEKVVS